MRVLVVEDESKMAGLLSRGLREEGHVADVATDGAQGLAAVLAGEYDVIVLDVMLPGQDGFEVCARMRARKVGTPVLMLTARAAVPDRVRGLDAGADDYLTKPFHLGELFARLRALARRGPTDRAPVLEAGDLCLDPAAHRVWRGETEISLSSREFVLLETLMRHPGMVHTRDQLLDRCWDTAFDTTSNLVDVYVRYLRQKIDRPFDVRSIETVRGAGYRLRTDGGHHAPTSG